MIDNIKSLFFNKSLKRWHFNEIVKETKISRERINFYLKELIRENIILRVKIKNKMPYYIANTSSSKFRFEKRLYGIKMLEKLFEHINSIDEIKTAILFGSFSRGDWDSSSDIDLFIYGNTKNFNKGKFESVLKKEIQLFDYNNKKKIKKELDPKLIPNILNGFTIKGDLKPLEVEINA
ncbi:nucleotidyltransferase domain-containing protein [Candidatus Woesearchaeota archaeon]|nr:nucleotidyltransferase domain-containing protein [Candidatus Woesearchaeota archaeon]